MIEIKNLTKYYGRKSLGLYDINFNIEGGQIIGIFDQNGSGKTTLLKSIMGLCELNSGTVFIDGKPAKEQYERLSFITEEGSFFPWMTPEEYGEFLSEFFDRFDQAKYHKLLDFFRIDSKAKIRTMSKGQKAKVETAAGFSKGADIILMDEPFSGKDMVTRKEFLKLINTSLRTDETILIATHLVDEIENMLDRAIILKYGRIAGDFYMDEIRQQGISLAEKYLEAGGYESERFNELLNI